MQTTLQQKPSTTKFSAERLTLVRESKGLGFEEFGRAIGRAGRSIRNWEEEKTSPTMRDLETIARVFGVELGFFITKATN